MAKHYETIPAHIAEKQRLVAETCDLCGTTRDVRYPWRKEVGPYDVAEGCVVTHETGVSYPEGGDTKTRSAELCDLCAIRVLDWIESQGGKTFTAEIDW